MHHPSQLEIEVFLRECRFERTRRSGPGGQHRNKVETAAIAEHVPTGIRAEANERRSHEQNRQVAIQRLRVRLALELRTPPTGEVSERWRSRTAAGKVSVNAEHPDFPALLAEALNVIAVAEFNLTAAVPHLGVSSSQLVKFLKLEPAALALVNRQRAATSQARYR